MPARPVLLLGVRLVRLVVAVGGLMRDVTEDPLEPRVRDDEVDRPGHRPLERPPHGIDRVGDEPERMRLRVVVSIVRPDGRRAAHDQHTKSQAEDEPFHTTPPAASRSGPLTQRLAAWRPRLKKSAGWGRGSIDG